MCGCRRKLGVRGATQFGVPATQSSGLIFGANRIRLGFKGEAVPGVTYFIQGAYDEAGFGDGFSNGLHKGCRGERGGGG